MAGVGSGRAHSKEYPRAKRARHAKSELGKRTGKGWFVTRLDRLGRDKPRFARRLAREPHAGPEPGSGGFA